MRDGRRSHRGTRYPGKRGAALGHRLESPCRCLDAEKPVRIGERLVLAKLSYGSQVLHLTAVSFCQRYWLRKETTEVSQRN